MLNQEGTYCNNQYYLDICFWKRDSNYQSILTKLIPKVFSSKEELVRFWINNLRYPKQYSFRQLSFSVFEAYSPFGTKEDLYGSFSRFTQYFTATPYYYCDGLKRLVTCKELEEVFYSLYNTESNGYTYQLRDHKHHRISGYRSLKHNRNYLRDSGAAYDEIQSNTKLPWRHRSRVNRVKHKDQLILGSWWDDRTRANRTAGWKNTKTRHQYKVA